VFAGNVIIDEGSLLTDLLVNAPTVDTLTAVRIIMDLEVGHSVTSTVDAFNVHSVGIGVTSREAFAAAVIPDPEQDSQYPPRGWLYVANKAVRSHQDQGSTKTQARFVVDLRAMRKIDKGVLYLAQSNNAVVQTLSVDVVGRVRVLCLT